ncbi:MAG: hypothetical protein WCP35_11325, partial [Verrucomicrobiota bacterium]
CQVCSCSGRNKEEAAGRMPAPRSPGMLPGASFQTTQSVKPTVLGGLPRIFLKITWQIGLED